MPRPIALFAVVFAAPVGAADAPPLPPPAARFGDARLRHPSDVTHPTLSADGRLLATNTRDDKFVRLWDTATGREVGRLSDPDDPDHRPDAVAFTPDGRLLVAATLEGMVVFDVAARKAVAHFRSRSQSLHSIAVLPDGTAAVALGDDGAVAVWDLRTGMRVRTLWTIDRNQSLAVGLSPDGTEAAACGTDGNDPVLACPVNGGRPPRTVGRPPDGQRVNAVAWPVADRVVQVADERTRSFDPATGKEVGSRTEKDPRRLDLLPPTADGRLYAKVVNEPEVVELDPTTLRTRRTVRVAHHDNELTLSRDGRTLATATEHAARLFDPLTGRSRDPDRDRQPADPAVDVRFHDGGRTMLARGKWPVRLWDAAAGRVSLAVGDYNDYLTAADRSPDGRWLAAVDGKRGYGRLIVWDARTGVELFREPFADPASTLLAGFDPAGRLWVVDYQSGEFRRLDLPSGRVAERVTGYAETHQVWQNAAGGWVTLAHPRMAVRDGPAGRWREFARLAERGEGRLTPWVVGVRPDGGQVLRWQDGVLTAWDVGGSAVRVATRSAPFGRKEIVTDLRYSPDGRRLILPVWSDEGARPQLSHVRVWEAATLAEVYRFTPPTGADLFAVTPDGRKLIAALPDTTFAAWDVAAVERHVLGPAPPAGPPAEVWHRLAGPDPRDGYAAVRSLAADPAAAVATLRDRFRPADPTAVAKAVTDLDAPSFPAREAATATLVAAGLWAEGPLRAAAGSPSAEVRARAGRLLKRFDPADGRPDPESLRVMRAVDVLERVGTPEARALLTAWASDGQPAVLAAEAKAALARMR